MRPALVLSFGAVLVVLSGATCASPAPKPRVAALRGFSSPEELRQYMVEQAKTVTGGGRGGGIFFPIFPSPPLLADTAEGLAVEDASGSSFSTTNIQEVGVDESDVVKNDGQTIYAVDGHRIHVVRAVPADAMAEIATIELNRPVDALYLRGATLVTLSSSGGIGLPTVRSGATSPGVADVTSELVSPDIFPNAHEVTVTLIDITDPAQPAVRETITFEGALASSRLIETRLHLVISASPVLPADPTPQTLAAMPLEAWIPDYQLRGADNSAVSSGDVVGWQSFDRPENPDGYGVTTALSIDIENPTPPFAATAISADAGLVYASTEALYIADTNYDYERFTFREDTAVHKLTFTS